MKKVRCGIFGSGYMGQTHAEAISKLENAVLIAAAGGSRASGLAARYGIVCEPDVESLAALLSMKSGKHALMEKPITTLLEDCERLIVGHILNSVPNAIDMLRWFTGAEVSTVSLSAGGFARSSLWKIPTWR